MYEGILLAYLRDQYDEIDIFKYIIEWEEYHLM